MIKDKCEDVSIYERVIVLTALYGVEAWGMRSSERRPEMFLRWSV